MSHILRSDRCVFVEYSKRCVSYISTTIYNICLTVTLYFQISFAVNIFVFKSLKPGVGSCVWKIYFRKKIINYIYWYIYVMLDKIYIFYLVLISWPVCCLPGNRLLSHGAPKKMVSDGKWFLLSQASSSEKSFEVTDSIDLKVKCI